MASNLNKAFMRAYAKDSARPVSDPVAAAPENARPAGAAPGRAQPAETAPQSTSRVPLSRQAFIQQVSASQAIPQTPAAQPAVFQASAPQFARAPLAATHLPSQTPAATHIVTGRYVQNAAPTTSVDPSAAVDAASVWQRIDAAQAIQPPHLSNSQSRPSASSVQVGAASGPKRMQAAANAPAPAVARTGELRQPPADLPLLADEPNASDGDPQATESRRRTVADFLYSAGKISGSAAAAARPAADLASRSAAIERPLGRSASAPLASSANNSVHASVYAPVQAPAKWPESETVPASAPSPYTYSPSMPPPSNRAGHIVRVDVPNQPRSSDADVARASAYAASATDQAMLDADAKVAVEAIADQQRRIERVYELSDAEQKLRRSKHKIFNPVWEVDSLQWPGVCDKLMEHRAESMAQVAAHLKAACQDGLSILGVTSPASGEGRTTVACCLARLAATHGLNVVLVDLDLEHPTLCLQTNLEVEHDWRDCLDGEIDLEEVAVHSIDDQLTLLPLKDRSDRPELLASDTRIADMLRELSESFELVIVDACRMNSGGNVIHGLAESQVFDAAIVVVDRRNAHHERIEDAVRVLQHTGVGSIGIVDNFSM